MADYVFFTMTGKLQALVTDSADVGGEPDLGVVTGLVIFTPETPVVASATMTPTTLALLDPITGRIDEDGVLRTINGDTGVKLVANSEALGPLPELVYKVTFTKMKWDKAERPLSGFRFVAPTTAATVDLSTVPRV